MSEFINKKQNQNQNSNNDNKQSGYVDIHCHCLPGLDDGPKNTFESLALCQALVEDGVTVAIATPHQLGQFDGLNEPAKVRDTVLQLNKELENNKIPITVMPGGDVRIDERICQLIEDDKIQTLADGGKYILLELPSRIFIDIEPLLVELAEKGIQAIISHPERHYVLCRQYSILQKWLNCPAHLQITAGSLSGDFGLKAQNAAWEFLRKGWVSFVATDAHNLGSRRPKMKNAYREISLNLSTELAHTVCIENPIRLLEGGEIISVFLGRQRLYGGF